MAQISFTWPAASSYDPLDFLVTPANKEAAHFIDNWPADKPQIGLLCGPLSSGKTHLAQRWATQNGAVTIAVNALGSAASETLWRGKSHALLENIYGVTNEASLFHLIRNAEVQGLHLLLTSNVNARESAFALADLLSRLRAMPAAELKAPDEMLLQGYLVKGFADRQMRVNEEAVTYLIKRMERSFAHASALVETIAAEQAKTRKSITIPFLKSLDLWHNQTITDDK